MKLTQRQLRALIIAETKRLREDTGEADPAAFITDHVFGAVLGALENDIGIEELNNRVNMSIDETGDQSTFPVLARYEDVENASQRVADSVMKRPELREFIENVAASVLRGMM